MPFLRVCMYVCLSPVIPGLDFLPVVHPGIAEVQVWSESAPVCYRSDERVHLREPKELGGKEMNMNNL